ncbi:MAG TPA: glycogen debranching N-terminal domain-containing protein, partial [Gemmatimonadales bacterium]|nr:glycogen debranching N-terminal domain-containing protein [Gemmatimonadales bacterium]
MLHHDLVLKHNELYLVGEETCDGSRERATGLYLRDTRFLSFWDLRLNGVPLESLDVRVLGPDRAVVVEANSALAAEDRRLTEPVLPLTIAVEQHVQLTADELCLQIVLSNYSGRSLPLSLSLEIGGDFRDLFDIRGFPWRERGGSYHSPIQMPDGLALGYADRSGATTRLLVSFSRAPSLMVASAAVDEPEPEPSALLPGLDQISGAAPLPPPPHGKAFFDLTLEPRAVWELLVTLTPLMADRVAAAGAESDHINIDPRGPARVVTDHSWVNRIIDRAATDLDMLQTSFRDGTLPAAGIPWFVAPFGRDSLIASLQTLHIAPGRAKETLRTLAALQGQGVDPFREEEPGKILHEMRYGEMARLGDIPHTPYYGTVDATALFVMLFAETIRWTGDESLYRELLPNVQGALEWIERWGDRDGDGLVEYTTQIAESARIVHQGWKDSNDSLHDVDGRSVTGAIALVEVQGYVYAAYRWLAEIVALYGDAPWATDLRDRAERVRRLVEDRFWMPEEGYYAQALDEQKRPVTAISSNAGHLLYCDLPSPERGRLMAARLRQPDLDSGWGVRTLAASMSTYNPMSYHNGSVWPHDNSLIAAGLGRYGEIEGLERIASALFTAAEHLPDHRLPELYCGFPRNEDAAADGPIQYPVSCSPQAWAAGATSLV